MLIKHIFICAILRFYQFIKNSYYIIPTNIQLIPYLTTQDNHKIIYQLITANISETINNCTFKPINNKSFFEEESINYHKIDQGYVIDRKNAIIQTFVSNPLLVKLQANESIKHVFHLRSYFFVASYSNPFLVLHWPKPILMINPGEYNNKQTILNKKVILTNRHQVEMGGHGFGVDNSYKWIWGQTQFQNYLSTVYEMDVNYTQNKLNEDIKHIIKHIFAANSYSNKLKNFTISDHNMMYYHFDVYCMDIIINENFELKLMEVNSHCGHMCEEQKIAKKKINGGYDWDCDTYYNEMSKIVLEIFHKKYHNKSVEKIDSLGKYEIVFWE